MKVILILFAILILFNKRNTIKSLFTSKEKAISELEESLKKLNESTGSDSTTRQIMAVLSIFIALGYILFYILSAVFINTFIFTIISIIFIIFTFKYITVTMKVLNKDYTSMPSKFSNIINSIIDIIYIFYVLYQIFIRW